MPERGIRQVHEETEGSMRGKGPDTGEARFDGPPRASQRREDANHTWLFDGERQPVSAIPSNADESSPNTSDPEALVPASRGALGGRPAESVEQTAGLLSPDLTTFEMDRESAAKLVQKLDELEVRLRNRGPDDNDSLRAALASLEAELRASRRMSATIEPSRQKPVPQARGEGTATRIPTLAGKLNACDDVDRGFGGEGVDRDAKAGVLGAQARQGVALETPVPNLTGSAQTMREFGECVSSLEQFDRLARDFQRSSTQ
ncbi:MAG: hypothetical protein WBW81_04420, partial [Methylocella sp.]